MKQQDHEEVQRGGGEGGGGGGGRGDWGGGDGLSSFNNDPYGKKRGGEATLRELWGQQKKHVLQQESSWGRFEGKAMEKCLGNWGGGLRTKKT